VSRRRTLDAGAADHRSEVHAAAEAFAAVPADAWERPLGEGKWSPAETALHLILAYERLASELGGGPSVRFLAPWWQRAAFRRLFLGRILRGDFYPKKVKGPPEARPEPPFPDRAEALRRLRGAGDAFERAVRDGYAKGDGCVTHPYLGRLEPADALRFFALHTRHHREQMTRRLGRSLGSGKDAR
jgi:uncharacterized damage-inducible protein DinB